jgi:oxaloacetate decarboxylase alpha subunit
VLQAVEHGADVVHTATSTLANGVSHTPTELFVRNCRRRGFDVDIDLNQIQEVADRLAYIAEREDKPVGSPREYDEFHYHHQCAGGMVSNLQYQLETIGLADRLEEILEEAGQVRMDLGYPIVISPFAQYIVTMALLNVMGKDQGKARYETVPDEVRLYVRGGYGEIAGRIDPNLYDRITRGAEPIRERPGALVPPALERLKKQRGPFASDDDLLLAAFYDDNQYRALKEAGAINTDYPIMTTPIKTLIEELSKRKGISQFTVLEV